MNVRHFVSEYLIHNFLEKMSQSTYENPDLKRERSRCSFNKDEITHLVDGGADRTKLRRQIGKLRNEFTFEGKHMKCIQLYSFS